MLDITSIRAFSDRYQKILLITFFSAFLLLGLLIFRDYGMYWDDPTERVHGMAVYNYIFHGDSSLFFEKERYHGPLVELILAVAEKSLNITNTRDIYLMRHLAVFLIFFIGVWFFYLLTKEYLKSWRWGLVGAIFLILTPRIFGQAFYNTKDIPCLVFFIIAFYSMLRYRGQWGNWHWGLAHALACAAVSSIRIVGLLLVFFTVAMFFYDRRRNVSQDAPLRHRELAVFSAYCGFFLVFIVSFLPILWHDTFFHITNGLSELNRTRVDQTLLYCGRYIRASQLPWHYIPVWVLVTTPLCYIFSFFLGFFVVLRKLTAPVLFLILWFFVPIILVIVGHSIVYDAWRHLYFIYPAFLMISLLGLKWLAQTRSLARGLCVLFFAVNLIFVVWFMVRFHPFEDLYFNPLAGRDMPTVQTRFEMDYWGLAYYKNLEYLLAHDTRARIKIKTANLAAIHSAYLLPLDQQRRLVFVGRLTQADYYLTNFREHKDIFPFTGFNYPRQLIFSVSIKGAMVCGVYALRDLGV